MCIEGAPGSGFDPGGTSEQKSTGEEISCIPRHICLLTYNLYPALLLSGDPEWLTSSSFPSFYIHNNSVRKVRLRICV